MALPFTMCLLGMREGLPCRDPISVRARSTEWLYGPACCFPKYVMTLTHHVPAQTGKLCGEDDLQGLNLKGRELA